MNEQSYEQVGRRVQCMVVNGSDVIAASQRELVFLDHNMKTVRTVKLPYEIASMDVVNKDALVVCGDGHIAQLNLAAGSYSRMITASEDADYCCVAARDSDSFFFGTTKGKVGVMQLSSGVELGSVEVGFPLRGLLVIGNKLMAYGGEWNNNERTGKAAAFVTIEMKTLARTMHH
jgi:hypothetical protein